MFLFSWGSFMDIYVCTYVHVSMWLVCLHDARSFLIFLLVSWVSGSESRARYGRAPRFRVKLIPSA